MKMFLLGMLVMYVLIGFLLVIFDGKGGIELFRGWLVNVLCFPVIALDKLLRFINEKIIHRGKAQVYSREKGFYWVKKDGE